MALSDETLARLRCVLLISALAPAGVLLRIILTNAFAKDISNKNSSIPSSFAANLVGSALLGVLHASGPLFPPALNTGLSTGFCASLTTFASAMFHSAQFLVSGIVSSALLSIVFTMLCSPAAYIVFRDITSFLPPHQKDLNVNKWISTLLCAAITAIILAALFIGALVETRRRVRVRWLAALLSPLGALTRYFLSTSYNRDTFPYGTLASNLLACCLDSALASIQKRRGSGVWIDASRLGLAGSLSTVSALASELVALPKRNRLFYGALSPVVAVVIIVIIYGSVVWST